MALTTAELKTMAQRHQAHAEAIGVALLATIVALALGISARRQAAPLNAERDRLRAASAELESFRSSFRATTPEEDAFRLPDSLSVGVSRDVRVTLAQLVAQRAEQSGLRDVRIRFAPPDSGAAPAAPDFGGAHIADYSIALECHGGMSSLLSLIRHLPPSVALERISATRGGGTGDFVVTLAVFETPPENAHG
jgi:hypothetical protein